MLSFERLKELKAEFEQVRKYNDRHCMSTVTEDDVIEVLDEAIARQSVKSEEVQEAIDWATEELNDSIRYQHNYKAGCLDTIIAALQAYQPTTRKDRIVEEVAEAIKQKTITDAMDYLNKNMKQPFIEKESELNDV